MSFTFPQIKLIILLSFLLEGHYWKYITYQTHQTNHNKYILTKRLKFFSDIYSLRQYIFMIWWVHPTKNLKKQCTFASSVKIRIHKQLYNWWPHISLSYTNVHKNIWVLVFLWAQLVRLLFHVWYNLVRMAVIWPGLSVYYAIMAGTNWHIKIFKYFIIVIAGHF